MISDETTPASLAPGLARSARFENSSFRVSANGSDWPID
jgi:hypothetical protein